LDSRESNNTPSQSKITRLGQGRPEGRGEAIHFDKDFGASGVVAQDFEIPLELAVQATRFQGDDNFSLPAGLDVRIKPHHLHASGVFYFGNGEEDISGIENLEHFVDGGRGFGQIPGIVIIRRNGNRGAGRRITRSPQPFERKNQTQSDRQKKDKLLHGGICSDFSARLSRGKTLLPTKKTGDVKPSPISSKDLKDQFNSFSWGKIGK
jgi:hypothetical protein